jgi:DnaJ-class molecular chaperone
MAKRAIANNQQIDIPQLEIRCSECGGIGSYTERYQRYNCPSCDGAGYLPTEAGKKILEIIKHNLRGMNRQNRELGKLDDD